MMFDDDRTGAFIPAWMVTAAGVLSGLALGFGATQVIF